MTTHLLISGFEQFSLTSFNYVRVTIQGGGILKTKNLNAFLWMGLHTLE